LHALICLTYECGPVSHTVNECPVSELHDGGLQRLHSADAVAANWKEQ